MCTWSLNIYPFWKILRRICQTISHRSPLKTWKVWQSSKSNHVYSNTSLTSSISVRMSTLVRFCQVPPVHHAFKVPTLVPQTKNPPISSLSVKRFGQLVLPRDAALGRQAIVTLGDRPGPKKWPPVQKMARLLVSLCHRPRTTVGHQDMTFLPLREKFDKTWTGHSRAGKLPHYTENPEA